MPRKKKVKKKASSHTEKKKAVVKGTDLDKALVHNLVELQKVNTQLTEKFDHLAKEISKLLALFEVTARTFAKNAPLGELKKDEDFLEKIDKLLDQNKTLAKGLTLMEERLRERVYGGASRARPTPAQPEEAFQPSMTSGGRPLPRF